MKEVRLGNQSVFVQYLQLALSRAGIPTEIDGTFGDMTCRSVQAFFGETGKCDVSIADWERLLPYLRGYVDYTIQSGDTFWRIAEAYRTDVSKILIANPKLDPVFLRVGTTIKVPLGFPVVAENVPYSSELNELMIEGLQARYPFLMRGEIGESVMGKPIPYLRLGNGSGEIFYSASYHANEWITTPLLLKFAEDYARNYAARRSMAAGIQAEALMENYTLYLVPMVNPDGVDLVNGVLEDAEYQGRAERIATDYPQIPFPSGWKANIDGIDLNLQFPAGWELAREIKYAQGYISPAPRDYVGPFPLAAPESRAVYEFTRAHDFLLILAYHTQGEVIYWKYKDYEPARSLEIAEYFSSVSGYAVEETPGESGNAGYKDWFIQTYDRPGYTIEAGLGENPLPIEQFPQIYRDNYGILLGGMTQAN